MMIRCNGSLAGAREQIREVALSDFSFFTNSVLAITLEEDLCRQVQDVVEDREDYVFHTSHKRGLLLSLHAWLRSQGVQVLCNVHVPTHEVLSWIVEDQVTLHTAILEFEENGVSLRWL